MKRVQQAPQLPGGPQCATLRPSYENMSAFLTYKNSNLNTNDLALYVGSTLEADLQNVGTSGLNAQEQAAAQQRLNENMSSLQLFEQRVATLSKCMQEDIIQKQRYSGQLYGLQQDIAAQENNVKEMEQIANESQERSDTLDAPYSKTTRWQTWFPLGRPLQQRSLPVLISFALLFLVLSLGMFLRLASIDLQLGWLDFTGPGVLSGYGIGR